LTRAGRSDRIGAPLRLRRLCVHVVEGAAADIRCEAVVELGVVRTRTDASGGIAAATAVTARVVYGGCAGTATAGGRAETACAEGIEQVEGEGVFFRGEIEDPQNVDYGEDEPAGCDGVERGDVLEYGLVDADDSEDDGD